MPHSLSKSIDLLILEGRQKSGNADVCIVENQPLCKSQLCTVNMISLPLECYSFVLISELRIHPIKYFGREFAVVITHTHTVTQ